MIDKKSPLFIQVTAFVCGMAIMAMEIIIGRMLAPFFGTSLFVWTNLIGVVLISLAIGYYAGGKIADKSPDINILLKMILAAGIFFPAMSFALKPILLTLLPKLVMASVTVAAASFVSAAIILALPLIMLGASSPFLIKILVKQKTDVGSAAGSISAINTIGSILGTFLPTFWLIPTFGARNSILIISSILILFGSCGLGKKKDKAGTIALLMIFILFPHSGLVKPLDNLIAEAESPYQFIQVLQDKQDNRYMIINEGWGTQSIYNKNKLLTGFYYDYYNLLPFFLEKKEPIKILILGLAGGTIGHQLNYFFKDRVQLEAVEIDKKVIELSRRFFDLDQLPMQIHNNDARLFLYQTPLQYDIIIVDAYQNENYIPWTMTTREFWEQIKKKLNPDGLVASNIWSSAPRPELLAAIQNTQAKVFEHTYLTPLSDGIIRNNLVISGRQELPIKELRQLVDQKELNGIADQFALQTAEIKFNPDLSLLTDDKAPTELLTDRMLFSNATNGN